jgi:membrane protein YqaA with SNARE-associated domain
LHRFLERVSQYLVYLGVPGVFLIALLDSAAIPMIGGPDAVILLVAWRTPSQAPFAVLAAALGSTLGCLILYRIGMAGGKAALARFSQAKRNRVQQLMEKNTGWALFMSVTMPPPFPTKPMILAAGVFRVPVASFTFPVALGRLLRYAAIAWLGARFGDQAATVIKQHYLLIVGTLAVIAILIFVVRRLRKGAATGQSSQGAS